MSKILIRSAKEKEGPSGVNMRTSVLEDEEDTIVLEEGGIHKTPMYTSSGEHSFSTPTIIVLKKMISSKIASCMKLGVDGQPDSRKRAIMRMQHIWQMQSPSLLKVLSKYYGKRWRPKNGYIKSRWKPIKPLQLSRWTWRQGDLIWRLGVKFM